MNQPTPDPLAWLDDELAELDDEGLRRQAAVRHGPQSVHVELDGQPLISFGSNDYLGLAADPRLADAAIEAVRCGGVGSGASPLLGGRADIHCRLESRLAEFEGTEAALLFPSGYAANVGTITALAGRGDAIYADAKNHASLVDGCRLSRAEVHVYRHADAGHLGTLLESSGPYRRRLIVTDGLFSMDGDVAPLVELAALADRYHAMLLVDEAHATGVFGRYGRGVAEQLGVEDRVAVRIGTLSKALGAAGGFVCGPQRLIDWLLNRARPYVFSTAPPPPVAAAALAAIQIVADEPTRRRALVQRAAHFRAALARDGWNVGQAASQIVPLYAGQPQRAMDLSRKLLDRGYYVPGIRPPSVPQGESLLRLSLTCNHTPEMIHGFLETLRTLAPSLHPPPEYLSSPPPSLS